MEAGIANAWVTSPSTPGLQTITDNNGNYILQTQAMQTILTHSNPLYSNVVCPVGNSQTINFSNLGDTSYVNFADVYIPNINDLKINITIINATPGIAQNAFVMYQNKGITSISNVSVQFDYDSILSFFTSLPIPTSYSHPTLIYSLGTLNPGQLGGITISLDVPTLANGGTIGTVLNYSASIYPIAGDYTPANNVSYVARTIVAAYDPNFKEVVPEGNITASDSVLEYTIHFQNTGNTPAQNVVLNFFLSSYLDISSFYAVTASHPYTYTIGPNNLITWNFNAINLPDSTSNEQASHGFASFSIKQKHSNTAGSSITNYADIYFDTNSAIVTNTTSNMLVDIATPITQLNSNNDVNIFPNLFHSKFTLSFNEIQKNTSLILLDVLGEEVESIIIKGTKAVVMEKGNLKEGIYILKINSEKRIVFKKIIVQ